LLNDPLQVHHVATDMLEDGSVDLRIVAWNEFAALGNFVAAAGAWFRDDFAGHGLLS
jgi:hypothetical protein